MAILTKEQILAADDMEVLEFEVPEWGGSVLLSTMTGQSRDRYEAGLYINKDSDSHFDNLRARFLSFCIVNEGGDLLFTANDLIELGKKSAAALDRVFQAASTLNGTSDEEMEEIAKN